MDAFKIIGIALTGAFLALTVKQYRPDFSICIALITGIILLSYASSGIKDIFLFMESIIEKSGIKKEYVTAVIKITGISYLTQFACELCRDGGQNAIASKLEISGKIIVLLLTLPVINDFLDICINAVNLLD